MNYKTKQAINDLIIGVSIFLFSYILGFVVIIAMFVLPLVAAYHYNKGVNEEKEWNDLINKAKKKHKPNKKEKK